MHIDLIIEDPRWDDALPRDAIAQVADLVVQSLDLLGEFEVSLMATSDADIARLNREFRGKPAPTNVLSWPAQELAPASPGALPPQPEPDPFEPVTSLGDVALAFETCHREAQEQGKTASDHVTHLVLHGILHLLGYDHETGQDAARMEALEVDLLGQLGIEDPYAGDKNA
ncbi:rRNA maturation RNase YbeY [Pseudaestuariivita atlantica]|uniref:Endoribonuclease YbeY n=1 Tax=Pseudaestuariivita atlantica TaxID=1317121 RepID=A0A0L1JR30_9RHOB|nr:rRNA maturation RNase YbeY [Pseudaestuariivita atlantica]KNG94172.1 rRNA maturation factor [Pseudaestuariivita atlantica]